jgi:hypothetical protein
MLKVHKFQDGSTIKAFTEKPEYGRIIVTTTVETFKDGWFSESKRVAFIKGKMDQLAARFGHLKAGDVFNKDLTVRCIESTEKSFDTQEPKRKGADGDIILHNGAPVYMEYEVAALGTPDVLLSNVSETVAQSATVEAGDVA